MMGDNLLLPRLTNKHEVDEVIRNTANLVVVLRFGRSEELECLQLDHILCKTAPKLAKMAKVYTVEIDAVPEYKQYFNITLTPATIFFFNAQHMKVDWGMPDNTKFIGSFKAKQDFIDAVEIVYRGAMRGKVMVYSQLDRTRVPKYDVLYKDI